MPVKNLITLGIGASPGSVAPFILLGLGVSPGYPSPETLLDVSHAWQLLVDDTDRFDNLATGALEWSKFEAGEVGTLRVTLKETGAALGIVEWQEIVLKDGATPIWGGYITQATPIADRMGNANRLTWEISAESYETILNRNRRVRKTYHGVNPGDILVDLFDLALDPDSDPPNQTEFDTSTYVTTGTWVDDFTYAVDGEKLTDALDRLALLAGYVWWIDAAKAVHFGAPSAATAPFGIKLAGDADYSAFFPPVANTIDAKVDASDIRNVITVQGGVSVSAVTSDTFTGDGSTLIFRLDHFPIVEIIAISVGGVVQTFGTDWYHSFADYDCLVNYSHGTVRWDTGNAPPNLDSVIVAYRYGQQTVVRVTDAASVTQYGRSFEYEIIDRSITSAAAAAAVANAMLDAYAYGLVNGAFSVNRLGIEAGQRVQIEFAALGLTGYYQVRRVVGQLRKRGLVTLTVQFGGKTRRLGAVLGGNAGGGPVVPGAGTGIAVGSTGGNALGGTARDQFGAQYTAPDYGSTAVDDTVPSTAPSYHIRWKNSSDEVLHRIEAYSDQTASGADREVLIINGAGAAVTDKYGYTLLQTISTQEAFVRVRAVGGYDLAGQQTASLLLQAYRANGNWDHSRAYLDADTVRVRVWSGASAPDPGTDSLPDGLLIYTDGTWNPGSGEGLYIYINAAWRPLAIVENARMYLGNSIDLEANHLFNVGNVDLEPGGTQTSNFNAGAATWYAVNTGSGNVTATLPELATIEPGRVYIFIKVTADANQMIVDGYSAETISGAASQSTTTQWAAIRVIARPSDWLQW